MRAVTGAHFDTVVAEVVSDARPGRSGRPRDIELDGRILEAARAIFRSEGYDAVSIAAVARAAGLPRSTVYRRYSGPVALRYAAAVIPAAGLAPLSDTGDIRADMQAHISANAGGFRSPEWIAQLRSLIGDALADPGGRRVLNDEYVRPRLTEVAQLLRRASDEGRLADHVDPDLAARAITGTLIYHSLLLDEPVDDALLQRLLDLVVPPPREHGGA